MTLYHVIDVKRYYSQHMSSVLVQPWSRRNVLSSLLEKNASEFAAQQEWEQEWNQLGLASRLSKEVSCLFVVVVVVVAVVVVVVVVAVVVDFQVHDSSSLLSVV